MLINYWIEKVQDTWSRRLQIDLPPDEFLKKWLMVANEKAKLLKEQMNSDMIQYAKRD